MTVFLLQSKAFVFEVTYVHTITVSILSFLIMLHCLPQCSACQVCANFVSSVREFVVYRMWQKSMPKSLGGDTVVLLTSKHCKLINMQVKILCANRITTCT